MLVSSKKRKKMNEKLTDLPKPEPFKAGFDTYLSPFSYRYGSDHMRRIWSQETFWLNVRDIWIAVAEVQSQAGIVKKDQVEDLIKHRNQISVERIYQFERDRTLGTGHDVAAAIAEYSEAAPIGGLILHQGLTSEDVLSNAEIIQVRDAFNLTREGIIGVLDAWSEKIYQYKDLVCMGMTHLQVAEPTTLGYRFARYADDLLKNLGSLDRVLPNIKGKGIKGPVGTLASLENVLGKSMSPLDHERRVMSKLNLPYEEVTSQPYPRSTLFQVESILSGIGLSLHRFALDLQLLQSSYIDEVSEPRRKGQIGSSAMPHKQNPVNAENIDSLTEMLPGALSASWTTGAFDTLERTLRDSAGKRSWLPESFIIINEALNRTERIVRGLEVHENSIRTNFNTYAPFTVTEIIMGKLVEAGIDRKEAHSLLVEHSEIARDAIRSGEQNPIRELFLNDPRISGVLSKDIIEKSFEDINHHVGEAPKKAAIVVGRIKKIVSKNG